MVRAQYYPWHAGHQARLAAMQQQDKLAHALLLTGPRNLGKRSFAHAFASALLCRSPAQGVACGKCDNCSLMNVGTHPDLRVITPEESRLIKIEQIRDLIEWASQTAQRGGMRVALLYPAEQMNVFSANALLKCLEEPGDRMLIMLVTDLPGRLLPTIRSRCQVVDFPIPPRTEALSWLAQTHPDIADPELLLGIGGGAPLSAAVEFDAAYLTRRTEIGRVVHNLLGGGAPLDAAKIFARGDAALDLAIFYGLFADAVRLRLAGDKKLIKNSDLMKLIEQICERVTAPALLDVLDAITRSRRAAAGPSNPNQQLLFEGLMVEVVDYCAL